MSSKASNYFKFCPVCGGKLKVNQAHPTCIKCGFIFYQNSKPTSSAFLINAQGELMLVKRRVAPFRGYWDVPGGFLEEGEDPIVGLKRELYEELGVRLKNIALHGLYQDWYVDQYKLYTINIIYTAQIASGTLKPQDDISEYQWFTKKTIPWSRLAFSWIRPCLKDFFKN